MIFSDSIETHKRDILKKWFKIIAISLIVVFLALKLNQIFLIGCGFYSKTLCSSVFVSGRDPQSVMKEDLAFHPLMKLIKARIDYNEKSVTSSLFGSGLFNWNRTPQEHMLTCMPRQGIGHASAFSI
jgi:hypothetical protein